MIIAMILFIFLGLMALFIVSYFETRNKADHYDVTIVTKDGKLK